MSVTRRLCGMNRGAKGLRVARGGGTRRGGTQLDETGLTLTGPDETGEGLTPDAGSGSGRAAPSSQEV